MEFFKKDKKSLSKKNKTQVDKTITIDSKSKKALKGLKTAQEKCIESACFFLVQETALGKMMRSIKNLILILSSTNSKEEIKSTQYEIRRISTMLQKKIEKFLLTEIRNESAPELRNFLLYLKESFNDQSPLDDLTALKESLGTFSETKDQFFKEKVKNLGLAEKLKEQVTALSEINPMMRVPKVSSDLFSLDADKAIQSQSFSDKTSLEKLLN